MCNAVRLLPSQYRAFKILPRLHLLSAIKIGDETELYGVGKRDLRPAYLWTFNVVLWGPRGIETVEVEGRLRQVRAYGDHCIASLHCPVHAHHLLWHPCSAEHTALHDCPVPGPPLSPSRSSAG